MALSIAHALEELLSQRILDSEEVVPTRPVHCLSREVRQYLLDEFGSEGSDPLFPFTCRPVVVTRPIAGCHPEKNGVLQPGCYRTIGLDVHSGLYIRIAYRKIDGPFSDTVIYVAYGDKVIDWRCTSSFHSFLAPRC
jgi:hypothetical protein